MSDTKKTTQATEPIHVDPEELAVATTDAEENGNDTYVHTFKKPFSYEGQTYETLTFDFSGLTGADGIAAQEELERKGKVVMVPAMNPAYLCVIAARACTVPLAVNVIQAMPLRDFNKITGKVRAFLLASEL